jgi:hypothetical protein
MATASQKAAADKAAAGCRAATAAFTRLGDCIARAAKSPFVSSSDDPRFSQVKRVREQFKFGPQVIPGLKTEVLADGSIVHTVTTPRRDLFNFAGRDPIPGIKSKVLPDGRIQYTITPGKFGNPNDPRSARISTAMQTMTKEVLELAAAMQALENGRAKRVAAPTPGSGLADEVRRGQAEELVAELRKRL